VMAGGAFAAVGGDVRAQAPTRSCLTDSDATDRAQYGTLTGLTDQDTTDNAGRGTLTNRTDSDATDPALRGRSWRCANGSYTGRTDSDSGANGDRAGYGRTGLSDSDSGNSADRAGYGRDGGGSSGVSDSDPSDPVGHGRGGSGRGQTGITDSDSGNGADRAGNGRGGARAPSQPEQEVRLPRFPWPPPEPSERTMLPRARLDQALGTEPSLYGVAEHLLAGLNRAGYSEHSFYAVPDGFALVARLERINDDGRPASEQFRYMPPGGEPFSLSVYVSSLFVAPIGRYRQIVFVVTGRPFVASGAPLTERSAGEILRRGANILPSSYRNIAFTPDHQVSALIYEFQKTGQQPLQQTPSGRLSALQHLRRAGIYVAVVP